MRAALAFLSGRPPSRVLACSPAAPGALPERRFHDVRHTCATLLLAANEHPKVVQELLGHSQIGLTLDTYGPVMPGMREAATAKLARLLAPQQDDQGAKASGHT